MRAANMKDIRPVCLFILYFCSLFLFIFGSYLDIDELNNMKYSMDILYQPISESDVVQTEGIKLSTIHGQNYYCKLPEVLKKTKTEENFNPQVDFPTSLLLTPIKHDGCLSVVKGWWTYKLCIDGDIQQYHSEDGIKMGDIIELGNFKSDFDWISEGKLKSSSFKQHKLKKYHSQYYDNGTKCELLDLYRKTEVRYYCDESANVAYIDRVDEPITCSYIISVKSRDLCVHPYFKVEQNSNNRRDIKCQPILSIQEFEEFNQKNVDQKAVMTKKESKNNLELSFDRKPELDIKFFKDTKETAIYFIKRFINQERLDKLSAEQQHKLVDLVIDHFDTFKDLPTADKARLVQIEIEAFLFEHEFLNQNPISKIFGGLNLPGTQVNNVNIEVYDVNNIDKLEGLDDNLQDESIQQLEEDLKKELENAGIVDANIKVHFISSKNSKNSKLSNTEAIQFKEMLMDIVGSSVKEQSEKDKYQKLNNNYNMVFVNGAFKEIGDKKNKKEQNSAPKF